MGLKRWIKRLERSANSGLQSFVLEDGSRHHYDPTSGERFLHSMDCLRVQDHEGTFPDPPETIKALTRARDRRAALELVTGGTFSVFPYDKQALVERGELVPRSLVAGRELGEPLDDLSE